MTTSPAQPTATALDLLRHAVRTKPKASWYLVDAQAVMQHTAEYRRGRIRNGLYSWSFVIEQLAALATEGWLHRPDGVTYVPTANSRSTWPTDPSAAEATTQRNA